MASFTEHHLTVPRTARYHTLGDPATAKRVWIVLHGYGQLARYFLRAFEGMEKESLFVAPEGLSRFYTDAGHTRVGATWMTREDREREIQDQVTYLDALAAKLREESPHAEHGLVLGFSQGVATATRWSMLGRTRVKRLVLWAGSLPAEIDIAHMRQCWGGLHVDLVTGERDTLVTPEQVRRQEPSLRAAGVAHAFHGYNGAHAFDPLLLKDLLTR
jgi:predicted esterase